jgi:hypothetical protein
MSGGLIVGPPNYTESPPEHLGVMKKLIITAILSHSGWEGARAAKDLVIERSEPEARFIY